MEGVRKSVIALVIAAVIAALVAISSYGTPLPPNPFAPVSLDRPTAADSNGEITAIADTQSRRLLVMNDRDQLKTIVSFDMLNAPIDAVTGVCVTGNEVYVSGITYEKDSDIIQSERVLAYDGRGAYEGIVFELKQKGQMTPAIKSLSDAKDGVVAAIYHEESEDADVASRSNLSFVFMNLQESKVLHEEKDIQFEVMAAGCSAESEKFIAVSSRGVLNDTWGDDGVDPAFANYAFTAVDVDEDGLIYAADSNTQKTYLIDDKKTVTEIVDGSGASGINLNGKWLSTCNSDKNLVRIEDRESGASCELTSVTPQFLLSTYTAAVWVSVAFLVVLALVLLARFITRRVRERNLEGVGALFGSMAVVLALGVAMGYLTYGSYQRSMETRGQEINAYADYIGSRSNALAEDFEKCKDRSAIRSAGETFNAFLESYVDLDFQIGELTNSATNNGIGMYGIVYGKDDRGVFCILDTTSETFIGSAPAASPAKDAVEKAFEASPSDDGGALQSGRGLRELTIYRVVPIKSPKSSQVVGVVEIGSRTKTLAASIWSNLVQQIITLLVLVLVIYLSYAEIKACGRCFVKRRKLQEASDPDALVMLTRPFSFAITILSSIDAVMTVLIARALISSVGFEESSPLIAIPTVMLGVGLALGQSVYGLLGSRIPLRRLIMGGCFVMLAFAIGAAVVVQWGNFWWYCVAKLLMAVPFGLLYTLSYSLPRSAQSDDVRAEAAAGVKRTDTSAAALGTVLGGFIASSLGNAWVYVLVALAVLPVLIMAANLLPKNAEPLEKRSDSDSRGGLGVRQLLTNRTTLAVALFVLLPATIASGYNSFIFPLFSSQAGLPAYATNNLFVLGQLVVYVAIDSIDATEARYGKWRVASVAVALLGVLFLLFSLNTTMVWAVVVIALVGVFCKSSDGWKAMWLRSAQFCGVPAGQATGLMFAARSVALIIQPMLLGLLLSMRDSVVVIIIGAICVLCAGIFVLMTRRTELPGT